MDLLIDIGFALFVGLAYYVGLRMGRRPKNWPEKGIDWCTTHSRNFEQCIETWVNDWDSPHLMPRKCKRRSLRGW